MVRRLLYLNGLAAIGVVLNHAVGWGFTATFWWPHRYLPVSSPNFEAMGSPIYYMMRSMEQLIIVSIPIFLFVSGFFISVATGRNRSSVDWKTILNRIKYLLIPYFIWSVVIFFLDFLESGRILSANDYMMRLVFGRAYDIFYFVPLLIQLYLLSPFIVPIAKNNPRLLLIGAGFLQVVFLIVRYGLILEINSPVIEQVSFFLLSWFFPGLIFWFVLGVVIGFRTQEFKLWLSKIDKRFLLALLFGLFVLGILEWEFLLRMSGQDWIGPRDTLMDAIFSGVFILTFLSFDKIKYPFNQEIGNLGTKSYGIYLVHSPVLEYSARIIYHLSPWLLGNQILFLLILVTLGLAIPVMFMSGVKKSPARTSYSYLFG